MLAKSEFMGNIRKCKHNQHGKCPKEPDCMRPDVNTFIMKWEKRAKNCPPSFVIDSVAFMYKIVVYRVRLSLLSVTNKGPIFDDFKF